MFGHPRLSIQTGPEAPKVVAKVNGKVKKIDKPWAFKYDLYFYRSTTSKRLMMYLILISPPPGRPDSTELVAGRQGGGVLTSLPWRQGLGRGQNGVHHD